MGPMKTPDAAKFLGVSDSYLRKARMRDDPAQPPYLKIGKAVRYDPADLEAWKARQRRTGSEAA